MWNKYPIPYLAYKGYYQYVELDDNNELVVRTFFYNNTKVRGEEWVEIYREFENGKNHKRNYYNQNGYPPFVVTKKINTTTFAGYKDLMPYTSEWTSTDEYLELDYHHFRRQFTPEYIIQLREDLKYFAWNKKDNLIRYINMYYKYPILEMVSKLKLNTFTYDEEALQELTINKPFKKFCFNQASSINFYKFRFVYNMFKNKVENVSEHIECRAKKSQTTQYINQYIVRYNSNIDVIKLRDYVFRQSVTINTYYDYFTALRELNYDLNDTKNIYPINFNEQHNLKINELNLKRGIDMKEKNDMFAKVCDDIKKISSSSGNYKIIVPSSLNDLINEGNKLHHCVGKMRYEDKVIDGDVVILFLRKKDNIKEPFVTLEISRKQYRIMQENGLSNKHLKSLVESDELSTVEKLIKTSITKLKKIDKVKSKIISEKVIQNGCSSSMLGVIR